MTAEAPGAVMWGRYRYRGHEVAVIQQWTDPFGRRMVRVASLAEEDAAAGMTEQAFLAEAELLPTPPFEGGDGGG